MHFALMTTTALFLGGCGTTCIDGTGSVEQRALDIQPFTGIEVGGAISVVIEKGATQSVTVTGQPNLIDLLGTDVKGGTWKIRSPQCWNSGDAFTVYIITPAQLEQIEVGGSGDVRSADVFGTGRTKLAMHGSGSIVLAGINDKELDASISGSGVIRVQGTCAKLKGNISGSGKLMGADLVANEADVKISGSGRVEITAITKLSAKVSGSGKVLYGGQPAVESKISGSGSVSPLP